MPRLRIATFNLLHGESITDGIVDERRLRSAVATVDADILGLQEVDRGLERSGGIDQAAVIADELGATAYRFVAAVNGTPGLSGQWTPATEEEPGSESGSVGQYGVALVSRFPVRTWKAVRFPAAPMGLPLKVAGRRGLVQVADHPRVAIAAVVDAPRGPMTVITAHLSFVPGYNARQLRRIVTWVRDLPEPRVLAADLNLPGNLPRAIAGWTQLARIATYPSDRPTVQFDHVLADGIAAADVRGATSLSLPVSDHCALAVDLTTDPAPERLASRSGPAERPAHPEP